MDGIGFVTVAMGMFGIGEIILNLEREGAAERVVGKITSLMPTREDWKRMIAPILRGTALGSFLGILPGGGALLASFAAYSVEKKVSKHSAEFGKGAIEGVAAPESANNAGAQASFIPMLTLGIPTSPVMALMIGAMIIQGVQPGPSVMTDQPALFWGVIVSMWIGNLFLLVLNLPMIGLWVRLCMVPYHLLYPAILVFCAIGVFSLSNSEFDVHLMALFGFLGYIFAKLECEAGPHAARHDPGADDGRAPPARHASLPRRSDDLSPPPDQLCRSPRCRYRARGCALSGDPGQAGGGFQGIGGVKILKRTCKEISLTREKEKIMKAFKSMFTGIIVVTLLTIAAATAPAMAQDYPNRPIRIISPYAPGGATDILPRLLAPKLQAVFGQPIIVENKPGANGNIGTEFVAKSKPDGYTFLMGNNSGVVINQNIYKLNIKPSQDLAPVVLVALVPSVLYVHPSVPCRRRWPNSSPWSRKIPINIPSPRPAAALRSISPARCSNWLTGSTWFIFPTRVRVRRWPMSWRVRYRLGFDSAAVLLPFVESKSVRPLATTGEKRAIALPNVPTMMEAGLAGFNLTNWYGLFAPAGTPKEIVDRMNREIRKILATAEFKDRITKMGSASVDAPAEEFRQFIAAEVPRWAEIVKKSNAKLD